jgi:hypothetical protein
MSERLSDGLLFEATDVDRAIVVMLPLLTTPRHWPAFNAVRHLNRAWGLLGSDRTVAVFYGITAEEEAATAVLHSLKARAYPGSERLKPHNHVQKNAVIPFFDGMTRILATLQRPPEMQFLFQKDNLQQPFVFEIQLPHPIDGMAWYRPQPPLHFTQTRSTDGGATYGSENFSRGFAQVARGASASTVGEYLRQRANLRNLLLYASGSGYPDYQGPAEQRLMQFKRNVFALLRMFLLIEPYSQHQSFVLQALSGFLEILGNLSAPVDFE